jgi:hypothetical protein
MSKEKLYFITFGNEIYYNSLKNISKEVENFNIFDEIIIITDKDLKNNIDFWNNHSNFIEDNKRGYGYWLWKPYINLKLLEKINENDIVVYADAGCTFNINGKNRLLEYIELTKQNNILSFQLTHKERKYTKKDLFEYFDYKNNDDQLHATCFIYKKCKKNYELFKLYYDTCCNYHLLNDKKSISKNYDEFIEHRHDQSIFSIIRKKFNTYYIEDETYPIGILKHPIWATRRKY